MAGIRLASYISWPLQRLHKSAFKTSMRIIYYDGYSKIKRNRKQMLLLYQCYKDSQIYLLYL